MNTSTPQGSREKPNCCMAFVQTLGFNEKSLDFASFTANFGEKYLTVNIFRKQDCLMFIVPFRFF
jgi:hypothetical protein